MLMTRVAVLSLAVCLVASLAAADVVHTSDGSRIVGTIEQIGDQKLVIVTDIAGKLEIDVAKVTSIETEGVVTVEFESGDRLVGRIGADSEGAAARIDTAIGELPVETGKIKSLWPEGKESPEVLALKAEAEAAREALVPDWSLKLEAGISRTEGNTDTLDARGRMDVIRKTGDDLLNFYLAADYSEQNNRRSKNEYLGGVKYENMISERAYWYTRLEMEHDEFENLEIRSTAAAGFGYYWLKEPDHEFKNRAGLGYRHESYDNGNSRDEAILDLGMDYRLDIRDWAQFTHSTTYSPDFEEFNRYRLSLDTALVIPLRSDVLKLKLGVRNDYNSRPQGDNDRLDSTYYANLLLELKD